MTWNYRLIKHENGNYSIHEVYYNQNQEPIAITEKPISQFFENNYSYQEIINEFNRLKNAFEKPILELPINWGGNE